MMVIKRKLVGNFSCCEGIGELSTSCFRISSPLARYPKQLRMSAYTSLAVSCLSCHRVLYKLLSSPTKWGEKPLTSFSPAVSCQSCHQVLYKLLSSPTNWGEKPLTSFSLVLGPDPVEFCLLFNSF